MGTYKDELVVGTLGPADDFACVTEVGFIAQQLNGPINENDLQFKCSMLVGKDVNGIVNHKLMVDKWETKYETKGCSKMPVDGRLQIYGISANS